MERKVWRGAARRQCHTLACCTSSFGAKVRISRHTTGCPVTSNQAPTICRCDQPHPSGHTPLPAPSWPHNSAPPLHRLLRLLEAGVEVLGQTMCSLPVGDGEVDNLGLMSQRGGEGCVRAR